MITEDPIYMARSVLLYLGLFGISYLLFSTSDEMKKRNANRSGGVIFAGLCSAVAIVAISLVAAFRADSVGVDTVVYPDQSLNCARFYSAFLDYLNDPATSQSFEPLNAALVWVCSRLSVHKWPLLFFYQLLTVLPVYCALQKLRDRLSPALGMAVYLFVFYNNSLNMMRQSVACAFILLAFAYLISEKKISLPFLICCVVAVFFHKSGLYGIVLLLAVSFVANAGKSIKKYAAYVLIIASPILLNLALNSLISTGLVSQRIAEYADIFLYKTYDKDWFINPFGAFSLTYLLIYSLLICSPKLIYKVRDSNYTQVIDVDDNNEIAKRASRLSGYLWNLNCSGYLLYVVLLISFETVYGIRFSIFFDYLLIFALPLACGVKLDKTKRLVLFCVLILFWFIWIQILGWSGSGLYFFSFE